MKKSTIGFVMCGSFCTLSSSIDQMEKLSKTYNIIPIMSYNVYNMDTKFGKASDFIKRVEEISGKKIIKTIQEAEPIGPKKLADLVKENDYHINCGFLHKLLPHNINRRKNLFIVHNKTPSSIY